MVSDKRIAILTNMVTPYRVPFFNELAKRVSSLDVLTCVDREVDRSWDVKNAKSYNVKKLAGITVNLNKGSDAKRILHFRFGIIWYLLFNKPDLIIIGDASWTSFIAGFCCRMLGINYLIWNEITTTSKISNGIVDKLRRNLFKRAEHCFSSCKMASEFLELYGICSEKISIVNNAVDNDYFLEKRKHYLPSRDRIRAKLGIEKDCFTFIYVGQLISRKRVIETIESVSRLSLKKSVHLLIAGTGPLEEQMKKRANELGFEDITFCGYTEGDRLAQLYVASDALILLSDDEPWGMVINESLLFNCLIYATRTVAAAVELKETNNGIILLSSETDDLEVNISIPLNRKVNVPTPRSMAEGFLSEL
ncbi:TPA: glycosyltransferase [Vibrio cholerae]|uniref:glycosyltransferase n=1 Tax=Vibrio cholerae TaxID=666 RepID=UPI0011D79CF8|nr:glycosyltransferase [Vibrio cholerae]QKU64100.1 glycosyltransferase [Vibrio cholerae]QKU67983.1 glycosyltransferase [Vibrio cholerae]TXX50713.1 glycosyltransferase [Vibrio cholerae]